MAVWKIQNNSGGSLIDMVRQSRQLSAPLPVNDIPNIKEAIVGIKDSLNNPMAVFGDYDCDGICGALILKKALQDAGANVMVRLPTRDEGYGIKPKHVLELRAEGIKNYNHR